MTSSSVSTLSETQDKVLSILPCFTSLLSCLGSAQIIYKVLTGRRTTPYRRILLGLSISDFLCSLIYPLQAFLLPRETSQRIWAVGNDASCTFLGFGQQIFFSSIFYNSMLSVYFLLTVRFGLSNEVVGRKYEPCMHALSIGYPLFTAVIGASMDMFHELDLGHGCWVNDYPEGCGCDMPGAECCRDDIVALFFGLLPVIVAFALILTNNLLVYCLVKSTIQRSIRRFQSTLLRSASTTAGISAATSIPSSKQKYGSSMGWKSSKTKTSGRSPPRRPTDPQLQRVRAVARQAFWYVAAFLITYLPAAILRILAGWGYGADDEDQLFPLLVLNSILLPSQGLFNVLVYIRPSFLRTRQDYPSETTLWVFRRALYGEMIQPTKDQVRRRPSSSDFGIVVRRMDETNRRMSVLRQHGMEDEYAENCWRSDDESDDEHGHVESQQSSDSRRGPQNLATPPTIVVDLAAETSGEEDINDMGSSEDNSGEVASVRGAMKGIEGEAAAMAETLPSLPEQHNGNGEVKIAGNGERTRFA